jgi:hypothetical protein
MGIQAAPPLLQTLVTITPESLISQNQPRRTLLIMMIRVPTCFLLDIPPKLLQYHFLLPLIIRFQLFQDKKKRFLSREKWQNNVANYMLIILLKSELPTLTAPDQNFVA